MKIGEAIADLWPAIQWTGGSHIHRSLTFDTTVPEPFGVPVKVITLLKWGDFPGQLMDLFRDTFTGVEWLMEEEDFSKLVLLDIHRHLTGQGDSFSEKKLRNPATGNEFHRLAFRDQFVGGVRFWVTDMGEHTGIGLRFRWELGNDDLETTRIRVQDKVAVDNADYDKTMLTLQIAEPTDEEAGKARQRVRVEHDDD